MSISSSSGSRLVLLTSLVLQALIFLQSTVLYGQMGSVADFSGAIAVPLFKSPPAVEIPILDDKFQPSPEETKIHFVAAGEHTLDYSLNFFLNSNISVDNRLIGDSESCYAASHQSVRCMRPPKEYPLTVTVYGQLSEVSLVVAVSPPLPNPWSILVETGRSVSAPALLVVKGGLIRDEELLREWLSGNDKNLAAIQKAIRNLENQELQRRWEKGFVNRFEDRQIELDKRLYFKGGGEHSPDKGRMAGHLNQKLKGNSHFTPKPKSQKDALTQTLGREHAIEESFELDLSDHGVDKIFLYVPLKESSSAQGNDTVTDNGGDGEKNKSGNQQSEGQGAGKPAKAPSKAGSSTGEVHKTSTYSILGGIVSYLHSVASFFYYSAPPGKDQGDKAAEGTTVVTKTVLNREKPAVVWHPEAKGVYQTTCPPWDPENPFQGCWVHMNQFNEMVKRVAFDCSRRGEGRYRCRAWVGEVGNAEDKGPCLSCEKHLGDTPHTEGLIMAKIINVQVEKNYATGTTYQVFDSQSHSDFYTTLIDFEGNRLKVLMLNYLRPKVEHWRRDTSGKPIWRSEKENVYAARFKK